MENNLAKNYRPKDFEDRIYAQWEENGAFAPDANAPKDPFTVMMPPPNITGQLHMGHALDQSLQDVLIRYKRMQGHETLWLPGTDHASIATEVKVVDKLREEEGLSKEDIGREAFLERAWEWKRQYGGRINEQIRRLGSSCDWKRERFTMDEGCNRAVKEHFINLYNKGLIYKGARLINWCPVCGSALSDIEVEHVDHNGSYWYFRYPGADGSEGIVVATSRPETMFADTAVAVHPSDERYRDLVGKKVILPLVGREIPVIADEYPDPEKGTGAVKITPSADPNDFEVGLRHGLEMIECIDEKAKMTAAAGKYEGMDRYTCRKELVKDLEEQGYLLSVEPLSHNVGVCYRCGTVVEPITSDQWFVKMKPLAEPAIECVKDGRVRFVPERFSKNYFNWMDNILDWCISRQLWWGHRIPAFYCQNEKCGKMTVSMEDLTVCPCCGSPVKQDPDVLDTWFSSALWPFSTMGWPEQTEDLKRFYPTSVLVTGYDIITFWVSRMIFSGLEHMGEVPFHHVFIHGLVRDAKGRKMSKSLGNGIDPLEIIDKYGADALRFALASGNSPGNDMRFSDEKIEAARNFANKLWNAARFVMMNLSIDKVKLPAVTDLSKEDKWVLSHYEKTVATVTSALDHFEVGVALTAIYDFTWDVYCDWYIELCKARLNGEDEGAKLVAQNTLCYILTGILKMLHPFMPFITEEIYQSLPHSTSGDGESIMISDFPKVSKDLEFTKDSEAMDRIISAIRAIRQRRNEMNVPPSRKAKVFLSTPYPETFDDSAVPFFIRLASASEVIVADAFTQDEVDTETAVQIVTDAATMYLPLEDIIDLDKERARLTAEADKLKGEIDRLNAKLANENFTSRAPAAVVEAERGKLEKYQANLEGVLKALEALH